MKVDSETFIMILVGIRSAVLAILLVCCHQPVEGRGANNLAFVANSYPPGLYVAQADTLNFTLIPVPSYSKPVAVDYDPVDSKVYWTDTALFSIQRSFLNGSSLEILVSNVTKSEGLALDLETRVMYWTDATSDLIEKATLDGLNRTVVVNLTDSSGNVEVIPRGIVLDTNNRYLFWTDWGDVPRIERANPDGSDRTLLIDDTDLTFPNGLALDSQGARLYWCDAGTDRIESCDLNGNDRRIIAELTRTSYISPFDIAVYDGFVYWTELSSSRIIRLNLQNLTEEPQEYGTETFKRAGGLHIYEVLEGCESTPCLNGGTCKNLVNGYTCLCLTGYSGQRCEINLTECPVACMNGGTCVDELNNPTCICLPGFIGSRCNFDIESPMVTGCPDDTTIPVTMPSSRVTHSWTPPTFTDNSGPPTVSFGCSSTGYKECHQSGSGLFGVGITKVMYNATDAARNRVMCSFTVNVTGQCDVNITHDSTLNRTIQWPPTMAGQTAESFERCTLNTANVGEPIASRMCQVVDPPTYFEWDPDYMLLYCGEAVKPTVGDVAAQVEVTAGNAREVAVFIANQTTSEVGVEIEDVATILRKIADAGSGDPEVTHAVVETVNNIIENQNTNDDLANDNGVSSSAIVQSVEAQISSTLQQEGMISIQQPTIHVEGVSLDPMEANGGFSFASIQIPGGSQERGSLEGTEVRTFNRTSEIPQDIEVVASIQLPQNIGEILQSSTGDNSSQLQASFIVYAGDDLFQSSQIRGNSSIKVAGSVVSLTVEGLDLVNLTEPLVIEMQVPNNATRHDNTSFTCVFWDFTKEDGVGDWSTAGCMLARQTNNTLSCNCNHTTNFAILVSVKGQDNLTDEEKKALDVLSQIGIALSIIALGATLIIYLSIKKLRSGKSRQIFIHFCVSLLLLYIVFLAGVDNAKGTVGACTFVAALLHYLALTTMMWMAVEARNMFVSTVKVFPEDTPRYMLKACLIAWGSPLIVVIITLASATSYYGMKDKYCFIFPGLALVLGLLLPIGIILLHNIVTFILVMRSLLKIQEVSRSQQISKRLQNAIGISALMGLTWIFGFLAIEKATFAFQLIFCLANSLQGVVIFIMFCIRREEVRTAMEPYIRRICCDRIYHLPVFGAKKTHEMETVTSSEPNSPLSVNNTAQFDISMSAPE